MPNVGAVGAALPWAPSPFAISSLPPRALSALDVGYPGLVALRSNLSVRKRRRDRSFAVVVRANKEEEAEEPNFNNEKGEKGTVDWDKAWSSFSKPSKKKSFLKLDMEQYVTRRPTHSNYPLSEEVDPLRKTERSALGAWTSLKFTYAVLGVIVGLAVYMVIIVGPPSSR